MIIMKADITKGVTLLFLFLGLGTLHAMGEVADTLSAEIIESDWNDSVVVEFKGDENPTSIEYTSKEVTLCNVYDLRGRMIRKGVLWNAARKELPSGVYLVNKRKIIIRKK